MKIDVLKEYIRKTVQEEIRNVLKEELKYQLTEMLLGGSTITPLKKTVEKSFIDESEDKIEDQSVQEETVPKKMVKYTSNPVLNEILNQTKGGVPRDGEMVGLIGDGFGGTVGREQINEVKAPENAPKEVKNVYQAMNKDYRSLMKAVDKKRNRG
jgi:hypothetical protein